MAAQRAPARAKAVRLSREYSALTLADADLFDLVGTLPIASVSRDRRPLLGRLVGGGDRPGPRVPAWDREVARFTSTHPTATGGRTVTNPGEDFEARLTRVLKAGAEELPVGQIVPPFATPHGLAPRSGPRRRTVRRKVAIVGIAVGLALTRTAAAATIVHLTSAPVTETDLARCYTVDSLAGGNNFRGVSVAAAGPIGSTAQVTNALSACTLIWQDGLIVPAWERK